MTPTDFCTTPPFQGPVGRSPQRYLDELPEARRPDSIQIEKIAHGGTKPPTGEQVRKLSRDANLAPLSALETMSTLFHFVESHLPGK